MLLCYCSTRSSENSKSDRTENEEKKRDALLLANHCMLCRIIRTCTVLHNTSNRIEHRSDRVVVDSIKRFDVFCSSSFILRLIGAFSFLSWSFFFDCVRSLFFLSFSILFYFSLLDTWKYGIFFPLHRLFSLSFRCVTNVHILSLFVLFFHSFL